MVITVFGFVPARSAWEAKRHRDKYVTAKAVFDERCKSAGKNIYKTVDDVEDVEDVMLLNLRPRASDSDRRDPNWADAGLPGESGGKSYIANFLAWKEQVKTFQAPPHGPAKKALGGGYYAYPDDLRCEMTLATAPQSDATRGYRAVDMKDEAGVLWRYTAVRRDAPLYNNVYSYEIAKSQYKGLPARYAVSYSNLIDLEDRKNWVAGITVKVSDTQSGEVLAKGTWYSFVPSLGAMGPQSTPWAYFISCPSLKGIGYAPTLFCRSSSEAKEGRVKCQMKLQPT